MRGLMQRILWVSLMTSGNVIYYNKYSLKLEQEAGAMCTKSELQTVLETVKSTSEQLYGDKLERIILYGSYARGDNTDESDIDIMIILDCNADEIKRLRRLTAEMASDISLEQEVFLSVLLRDRSHFESNLDFLPFYQNIAREGITVYG